MAPRDLEAAYQVRDLFYEAAVAPDKWGQALDALTSLYGGWGATLVIMDKETLKPAAGWLGGHNWDPAGMALYATHYGQLDPAWPIVGARTPLGHINSCNRFLSDEFARKNEFYQEFLVPLGGRYLTGGRLFDDGAEIVGMSVHTGTRRGPLQPREFENFQALWPSLMSATRVFRTLAQADVDKSMSRLGGMLDAFERMTCAAALVNSTGRILAMNARAQLHLNDAIRIVDHRIVARHRDSNVNLQNLIASANKHSRNVRDTVATPVARSNGRPLIAVLMPILGIHDHGIKTPSAIILLIDPDDGRKTSELLLVRGFGLTPAEARLASLLAGGGSIEDAGEKLGIRYQTARSHLKTIYQKMGVRRQGELVALLARIALVETGTVANRETVALASG